MRAIALALSLIVSIRALRDPPASLRTPGVPIALERVLDGKNLTAVVIGAKTVSNNTIQVTLEANISSSSLQALGVTQKKADNRTAVRIVYAAQDATSLSLLQNGIYPLFTRPEILNVTSIELVPFGKASMIDVDSLSTGFLYWHPELQKANITAVYRCPNGEGECESSLIHACAIKAADKDPGLYIPFISCMARVKVGTAPEDASFVCSNSTSFMEQIRVCALGPEGVKLQKKLASEAAQVSTIPSISIDGRNHPMNASELSISGEFTRLVCDALFAAGKLDRDTCEGKTESAQIIVPFQSILPSNPTPKATVNAK